MIIGVRQQEGGITIGHFHPFGNSHKRIRQLVITRLKGLEFQGIEATPRTPKERLRFPNERVPKEEVSKEEIFKDFVPKEWVPKEGVPKEGNHPPRDYSSLKIDVRVQTI